MLRESLIFFVVGLCCCKNLLRLISDQSLATWVSLKLVRGRRPCLGKMEGALKSREDDTDSNAEKSRRKNKRTPK